MAARTRKNGTFRYSCFCPQHLVVRHDVGVRPDVEMRHAEHDRQEQQRHHRQHARAAPIGRRITTPQAPPESWCIMPSARQPSVTPRQSM